jgi:PPM family protein phosphatase
MTPIRDIAAVQKGTVLYHSAFGFAIVVDVEPDRVILEWEDAGNNLPSRVASDVLSRVYAVCEPGGFFHQALTASEQLKAHLQAEPAQALELLLNDLLGPQTISDVQDWVVGRKLLNAKAFEHWWQAMAPVLNEDPRFILDKGTIALQTTEKDEGPEARFQNPMLAPGRRLDLALQNRDQISEDLFFDQVILSWRTGGTQVRDLALAALRDRTPTELLGGLLEDGPDAIEALIHAIRRAGWDPDRVDEYTHQMLIERVLMGTESGGPVDNEGRLAATLFRWQSAGMVEALSEVGTGADGKRLLRATFAALPPRRGEVLALALLTLAVQHHDNDTAQWLGGEALAFALIDHFEMADRIEYDHPELAQWYRNTYVMVESKIGMAEYLDTTDDTAHTAEIDLSDLVSSPIPLGDLPPRSGASLLGLGLALSRALAVHHKDGAVCSPTARSVRVLPNETMEIEVSPQDSSCPRPLLEGPSLTSDVFAAAVLLLEALIGRQWPRNIPAHRAIPYLRTCIPLLPPSALAPLDAALHPIPDDRPSDGLAWLSLWQAAAVAEETRGYAARSPNARLHVGYDSHIGRMKILATQTNQDAIFVSTKGPLSLLVVCDGISTANAGSGDVASSISTHVIANLWEQALPRLSHAGPGEIREFLDRALRMANTAVCDAALRFAGGDLEGRVPMGTTCVVAIVHGNWVSLAWLGDSRAYLCGGYGASLITSDENQAGERLKAWHLNFIDAWDPAGFALVGYLGHFNEMNRPEALPAHHTAFTLVEGERIMIATDGVTDYIGETHPEVSRIVNEAVNHDDPDDAARLLVNYANKGGGGDNATCLVATLWHR